MFKSYLQAGEKRKNTFSFGKLTCPCLGSEGKAGQDRQRTKEGSKLKTDVVPSDSNYSGPIFPLKNPNLRKPFVFAQWMGERYESFF